ncbi:MAG: radical SAM protein [Candidatus Nanohaloarchaea archaeon]|nr:radical SAM protein [Candidatus Nanohaloarchaea archaeon]
MHEFAELVSEVREQSFDSDRRRYHRFRYSSHDNTVVADCVGSNLRCAHEWGWCEGILDDPAAGQLHTPGKVVERLEELADDHGTRTARFSGMEPVIGDDHLVRTLERLDSQGFEVRIDTNGMLLDESYAERLETAATPGVRLSFKGSNPENFSKLARIAPEHFQRQIDAFQACIDAGIDLEPVLAGVYGEEERAELSQRLGSIDREAAERLTVEPLHLCPANRQKLEDAGFDLDDMLV